MTQRLGKASSDMQQFIAAWKNSGKNLKPLNLQTKLGTSVQYKLLPKNSEKDLAVFDRIIKHGNKEYTTRFTYYNGNIQPHIVIEKTPRGVIEHRLTSGTFNTRHGLTRQLGTAQLVEGGGTFKYYGHATNPIYVKRLEDLSGAEVPNNAFKNIINYIRGQNAVNHYKNV